MFKALDQVEVKEEEAEDEAEAHTLSDSLQNFVVSKYLQLSAKENRIEVLTGKTNKIQYL